jgi:hypothetical protein
MTLPPSVRMLCGWGDLKKPDDTRTGLAGGALGTGVFIVACTGVLSLQAVGDKDNSVVTPRTLVWASVRECHPGGVQIASRGLPHSYEAAYSPVVGNTSS